MAEVQVTTNTSSMGVMGSVDIETFAKVKLTSKGLRLLAKAQTGTKLQITRAVIGDGYLADGQDAVSLTELVHEVASHQTGETGTSATVDITLAEGGGNGTITVRVKVKNGDTAFYFREIGLMANDPDDGEILYAYTNAGDGANGFPAYDGSAYVTRNIDLAFITSNAANITANITLPAEVGYEEFKTAIDSKVDKITGYNLSENSYSDEEKKKLAGIAEGAEVNVQADWNATDTNSDSYIKNKPSVDSALSTSSTNAVQNKVVATGLNNKLDKNATIGGKNLVLNSKYNSTLTWFTGFNLSEAPVSGNTYTIQIKATLTDGRYIGIYDSTGDGNNGSISFEGITPVNGIYTKTVKWNVKCGTTIGFALLPNNGKTETIEWIKIEKGTIATDWTAAPEDIAALKTTYASTEQAGLIKLYSVAQSGKNVNRSGLIVGDDGTTYVACKSDGGILRDGSGGLYLVQATNEEISAQTSQYKAITPANLKFAVGEGLIAAAPGASILFEVEETQESDFSYKLNVPLCFEYIPTLMGHDRLASLDDIPTVYSNPIDYLKCVVNKINPGYSETNDWIQLSHPKTTYGFMYMVAEKSSKTPFGFNGDTYSPLDFATGKSTTWDEGEDVVLFVPDFTDTAMYVIKSTTTWLAFFVGLMRYDLSEISTMSTMGSEDDVELLPDLDTATDETEG